MSLKSILDAQKSGELDLLPGSPFNNPSPLVAEDGGACVMMDGVEWYLEEINHTLIVEALELVGLHESDVEITETKVVGKKSGELLFSGDDISDLFVGIASEAGIYTERY